MYRFQEKLNERGYTLIESLFQLMVFVAFIQLILLFFLWKAPIERSYGNMSNTEWALFVVDLQKELENVTELEVHSGGDGILIRTTRGRIDIEHRNAVIRKRVFELGHIPFLTKVHSVDFTHKGTTLLVNVVLLDGTRKEADFAIGLYPE